MKLLMQYLTKTDERRWSNLMMSKDSNVDEHSFTVTHFSVCYAVLSKFDWILDDHSSCTLTQFFQCQITHLTLARVIHLQHTFHDVLADSVFLIDDVTDEFDRYIV